MLLLSWGSAIIMTGTEVQPPTMHLAYFEFSKSRWQINRKEPCGSAPSVSLTLCSIRRPTCFFFPLSILRKVCSLPSSNYCNLDDCGTTVLVRSKHGSSKTDHHLLSKEKTYAGRRRVSSGSKGKGKRTKQMLWLFARRRQ
jgi:hypothetical protein